MIGTGAPGQQAANELCGDIQEILRFIFMDLISDQQEAATQDITKQ